MFIKISAVDAVKILKRQGLDAGEDGRTFFAYDKENDAVYAFESKKDRDGFVARNNSLKGDREYVQEIY